MLAVLPLTFALTFFERGRTVTLENALSGVISRVTSPLAPRETKLVGSVCSIGL